MRHFLLFALIALLVPAAHAKEQSPLRERVRDGVMRTDKDFETLVHRDKLNEEQRSRFDAAVKDLNELREAVGSTKWEGERQLLERAVDNIDFVITNGAISESDRQTLGIDVYTLRVILDSWK
jgi:hypothetical protein